KSEAELGELCEQALAGTGLLTGYRAHRPYIEIKVWCGEENVSRHAADLARLEQALSPWLVARGDEDPAANFLRTLARDEEMEILDAASGGLLAERLGPLLRHPEFAQQAQSLVLATEWAIPSSPEEWLAAVLTQADEEAITLALAGPDRSGRYWVGLREGTTLHQENMPSPYPTTLASDELNKRGRRYAIEVAFRMWRRWLENSVN
ncbi:MAG: hypothetical protein NDJ90_01325, partial [Oligoflexia bacterium]|nr:hypothetical protein [Oligoflexia bacterium]